MYLLVQIPAAVDCHSFGTLLSLSLFEPVISLNLHTFPFKKRGPCLYSNSVEEDDVRFWNSHSSSYSR